MNIEQAEEQAEDQAEKQVAKKLPSLNNAETRFKQQLGQLSKRELVRQASNYYMRLTLSGFHIEALKEQVQQLTEQLAQKSES